MSNVLPDNLAEVFAFVPSYNHAPFVEKCLKSIINQTLPPKKLLVIDDGSKDDSVRIIERVLQACPFESEFISRENRGLCATLNEGFVKTDGEFFAYLGSDDIWLPTFLEERIRLLKSRPRAVLGYGNCYIIDNSDNIIQKSSEIFNYTDGGERSLLLRGNAPFSPTVVYRRSILENFSWNEACKLEDYDMYVRLLNKGEFAFDWQPLSAWRNHDSNTSRNLQMMLDEIISAQNRAIDKLNLTRQELDKIQREFRFAAVSNFVREGCKRQAAELFINNLSGAKSFAQIGKTLVRLAVPQNIFQWNRRRKEQKAIKKYGKLEI